jgi:transcriptional regulator with XRE-family HTH domain
MDSASLIREARLRAGLTQRELAERLGTTQSSIARWEAGRARPSAEALGAIARACGLELRVSLVEPDPSDAPLLEHTLNLTPAERLDQLVRAAAFIRAGRAALAQRRG